MKWRPISVIVVASFLEARVAISQPRIDPGADRWLVASDIPPFSFSSSAAVSVGGALGSPFFGDHTDDLFAATRYRDDSRGISVEVAVVRNGRPEFLDHLIEAVFRDGATGRMNLPQSTTTSVLNNTVFFFCDKPPPNCESREYMWRSGPQLVIKVKAHASTAERLPDGFPQVHRIACAEPIEILQAYLERYPSAITAFTESDDRAKQWRRDQAALRLAAAEYQLDGAPSLSSDKQSQALDAARDHLTSFAELRRVAFGGASATKEAERIAAARQLPIATQLTELNKIRQEYRQWWNAHQNDPVSLPPP